MKKKISSNVIAVKNTYTLITIQRDAFRKVHEALMYKTDINVPFYDAKDDKFFYQDGKTISNSDPVFKEYKWF